MEPQGISEFEIVRVAGRRGPGACWGGKDGLGLKEVYSNAALLTNENRGIGPDTPFHLHQFPRCTANDGMTARQQKQCMKGLELLARQLTI